MIKKVIGADTKAFFAVIIILTIIAASLMIFKPITVGAFTAKGVEWENKTTIIATAEQQPITQHIVFGDSRPANCTNGVYVESGGHAVPFSTKNEVYGDGLCAEADVVITNTVYKTTATNPSAEKSPIAITGSQVADTTTYTIYYGLKTANAKTQAIPPCSWYCNSASCASASGECFWMPGLSQCVNIHYVHCYDITSSAECAGPPSFFGEQLATEVMPQVWCGWNSGSCVSCSMYNGNQISCESTDGCMYLTGLGECTGKNYCAAPPPTCIYNAACCGGLGGYTNDDGITCFNDESCVQPCVACGSPEDLACGGFCQPGESCAPFLVGAYSTSQGDCHCVTGPPVCTDMDADGYGVCPNCGVESGCGFNGNDCDDANPAVNPDASEVCNNGIDDNCDGLIDCADSACAADQVCQPTYSKFTGNTTDFATVPDITQVQDCTLEDPVYGQVVWQNPVDASGANFDSNVNIGQGFVSIDSAAMGSSFNSPATIHMYGVTCPVDFIYESPGYFGTADDIISSGTVCPDCSILSCESGTVTFSVTHFSGYAAGWIGTYVGTINITDGNYRMDYFLTSGGGTINDSSYSMLVMAGDTVVQTSNDSTYNAQLGSIYPIAGVVQTDVSACKNLTTHDLTYTLTQNLTGLQPGRNVCIDVQADNVTLNCDNYNMSGPSAGYGIYVAGRNNVTIANCTIYEYDTDIYTDNTNYSTIENNGIFNASTPYCLVLANGWHNEIMSNYLNYSLAIGGGGDNYIYNNTLFGNSGMRVETEDNDTFSSNVITGIPMEGLVGITLAYNTTNSTVFNNTISEMTANYQGGINIDVNSTYNNLTYNNITNCLYGTYMRYSALYNNIVHNWITNSTTGVFVSDDLGASYNNTFYDNYFNNTANVNDSSTGNIWNATYNCTNGPNIIGGSCTGGNFWSDYNGTDDGSGTYPHNISGDGVGDTQLPWQGSTSITVGGDYLPLTNITGPVLYNLTVYIDGVETTTFANTSQPYLVDVLVANSTSDPQQNVLVGIEEANGRNIFLPLLDSGYIYKGKAYGLSNATGFVEFVIAPTNYSIQDVYNYSIAAVVLNSTLDVTQQVNLTVADTSSLNVRAKSFSNQDTLKTRSENMLKIISNLKAWADAQKEMRVNLTVYLNGTYDSPPQVSAGVIHRVNITLINQTSDTEVQGDLVPVELNGYLINAVDSPDATRNHTNFAQGIKTGQIFYIVPSNYSLTPYDKLIFNITYGGSNVATINLSIYSDSLTLPSTSDSDISNSTVADNLKTYAESMLKVISNIKACVD
jgi:hypothetical protein